jgi:hypothetical protein
VGTLLLTRDLSKAAAASWVNNRETMVACRKFAVYLRPVYRSTALITGSKSGKDPEPEVNMWD